MMKKLLLVSFLTILLFTGAAQAQTNDLPEPGMLPDSPFYFLKSWAEDIGTFFTFGDLAKAERFLNLSEKRLAEASALTDRGKSEVAERVIGRYQEQLGHALAKAEEAKAKGLDTDEVLARVSEATLRHQSALADVYEKVPEQARPAIERAMQAGMRGHEEALEAISGQKREEIMENVERGKQEIEQNLERLRDRGVPVPDIPVRRGIEMEEIETFNQFEIQEQEFEVEERLEILEVEIPEDMRPEDTGDVEIPEIERPETPGGRP